MIASVEHPEHCGVVVAHADHAAEIAHDIDALGWLGAVTHEITDLHPLIDPVVAGSTHHCAERFEVAVDVAENGYSHDERLRPEGGSSFAIATSPAAAATSAAVHVDRLAVRARSEAGSTADCTRNAAPNHRNRQAT